MQYVTKINGFLRKNRIILRKLYRDRIKKARRSELLRLGFKPEFCTNVYRTKTDKTYFFSYDYGILFLQDDLLAIVKKKEYLE